MLRAYRMCWGGENIDYKSNFKDVRQWVPQIKGILEILRKNGVKYCWWFFEPYVEITWMAKDDEVFNFVKSLNIHPSIKYSVCEDGGIADWYCLSDWERSFGYKCYSKSAEMAELFYDLERWHNTCGFEMKGWDLQLMRRFHVLCNQLGYNYKQEGVLLIKRGVLALLFWFLGHHKAVWIYTKILRQKY